ncbi:MAG: HEAT repeat domain-containing protein, partial [Leptospiraceae bacterium]|nr:HEAT repeat domain-containing protein [Leptospiraceae bacterium]
PDNINFETIKENFFFLLGEISYKSLLKNSPFISGEIIVEALKERNNQKEFQYPIFQNLEIFLEPGFLKGDSEKKEKIKKEYQFNHLTFQEYFAGYYLSKLDKETLIEKFIESKLLKQFEIVYWFATGLYCKTPQTSKDFFEYLWKEPIDLIGSYNLQLILGCTGQLKTLDKEIQSKLEREVDRLLIYERKTKNVIITGTLSISYKYLIYKYAERFWKNIEYEENYYNYSRESFKLLRAHPESSKRLGKCFNVVDGLSVRFLRRLNIPNNTINNTILLSLIDEDLSNRLEAFKALWGLSQIDSNIKKGLIVSLKDEDAKARLYASQALIRFGFIDLEIINTLLHLLKENNIDIKIEAIQLLEKSTLKDLRIIKELYNNFNNEENKIKFYSAKALITLGEKDLNLIDYLFLSLKSKGIESFYAAITLGNLGKYNSNIIKRLLLSLKNENRKLRINAIHALEIAKKLELTVIEELCFSQKDEDELVKKYTLQIISKLIKVNPQIINILLKALKDNSKKVRSKAIEVLINSDIMVEKTTWDEIKENTFGNKRLIFIEKYLLKKVGIKESLVNFFKFLIEKKVNITSDIFKKELREILTISPYSLYQTKIKEFKFPSLINAYIHYPSKKLLKLIYHKALQEKIPIFVKEGKVYIPQISKGPIFWEEKVNPKDLKSIENKFIRFISKYKPGGFFENLWIKLFKRVM